MNRAKVLKELHYNGWLKFIFQYIYYVFETGLVLLIIVFGQKAFEKWFHNDSRVLIPYVCIITVKSCYGFTITGFFVIF